MKTCTKCGAEKPLSEFYQFKPRPMNPNGGYFGECKACNIARVVEWNRANPDKVARSKARAHRSRKLREKYGLTLQEYDALLAGQNGKCAICGTTVPGRASAFFPVDHDHESGSRRGLLCHDCNLGISHFDDDPDRLLAAAMYLLGHRDALLLAPVSYRRGVTF